MVGNESYGGMIKEKQQVVRGDYRARGGLAYRLR